MTDIQLYIEKAGLQTSIQDLGRGGAQQYGVPLSGAMDQASAKRANELVGNHPNTPVLEMTLLGPRIHFRGNGQMAICGAGLSPKLNGKDVPNDRTLTFKDGDRLTFGKVIYGCRAYLAIAGKWNVHTWLGSCSASPFEASLLTPDSTPAVGDHIRIESKASVPIRKLSPPHWIQRLRMPFIKVFPGPEFEQCTREDLAYFFSHRYRIAAASNRMAYSLEEAQFATKHMPEMISSGVMPGTIQLPPSGKPLILMRDAQTVGGYPRILQVAEADIDLLAQYKPGDTVAFYLERV